MRLRRLDLTRYGRFTDFSLDFGEAEPGGPDLHIVYGPNEAGKSTTFSAWLDLLYGIEPRSRYDFLHPYATMRIGAQLELDGETRELARVKRAQNSLLDASGQPVAERIALGALGGIDRDAYRTMFSLDDHSLEAGGESILASKGDLGQLLFSASAGLADLSRSLAELREEAERFYRYRARGGRLAELKARLAALKEERERIDTLAGDYRRLVEERDAAGAQYDEAVAARAQARARMDEIRRLAQAMPRLAELRGLREELAALEGLPEAPDDWAAELPRLQQQRIALGVKRAAAEAEEKSLSEEIDAIAVDEKALALGPRLDGLGVPHARHVAAEEDLPNRRLELAETRRRVEALAKSLRPGEGDAVDAASLPLDAATIGALRALMETRSGVEAALAAAREELAEALRRRDSVRIRAQAAGVGPAAEAGTGALAAVLAAVRESDHAARRRLAERARRERLEAVAERIEALKPWAGDLAALAAVAVPAPAAMAGWERRLDAAELTLAREAAQIERLGGEQRRLKAELEAIGRSTGIVADGEAAAARAEREKAWAAHRRALDVQTADAFEALMRRDDIVANARLANSAAAEKSNQTAQALALAEARLAEAREARRAGEAELAALKREVAAAAEGMPGGLPAELDLLGLQAWLERREQALDAGRLLREAERALAEAEEDGALLRRRLEAALAQAGIAHDVEANLDALTAAAQAALDNAAERARLRSLLEEAERQAEARADALARAEAAGADWSAAWARTCAPNWLGTRAPLPGVAAMGEILSRLATLEPALRECEELADRVAKMERDRTAFSAETGEIAAALGIAADRPPLETFHAAAAAVEAARAAASLLADRRGRLEEALRRRADIEQEVAVNDRRCAEMTAHLAARTLEEAAERLRLLKRRAELRQRVAALEAEVVEAARTGSFAEARTLLEAADRAALEQELARIEPRSEEMDRRVRELFSAHARAAERVEAVGGDDAAARIEQARRTVLIEIEDEAKAWLRLRAGVAAAEAALRAYRDRHRSAMMARASQAFATISRAAYSGLATQPERDGETLVARAADGGSKLASDLSRGTRFQLYLALRVAGYLEFAETRRPVPFVADDIMETFDDFRAEEAFRLFGAMARAGQVIYLTHHRHLIEIARRVAPRARVHELPG